MKRIGIICAMNEEMAEVKNIMTSIERKEIFNLTFFEGKINDKDCVLVECGVGKVNAARTTQVMISNFDIEYILNIGVAGAVSKELDITDIVIGDRFVQHDFDITAFGHEKGYITDIGTYIYADKDLVQKCKEAMESLENNGEYKVKVGTITSGDIFCTSRELADQVEEQYNALCIEMEGASIAQICHLDNIPFTVIRSISDSPNGNNHITFNECLEIAAKRGAEFLKVLLK